MSIGLSCCFQIKGGTWHKTILEVNTSKTHRLPIHDVAVYDFGDTGEEFGLEIGPVCFSWCSLPVSKRTETKFNVFNMRNVLLFSRLHFKKKDTPFITPNVAQAVCSTNQSKSAWQLLHIFPALDTGFMFYRALDGTGFILSRAWQHMIGSLCY